MSRMKVIAMALQVPSNPNTAKPRILQTTHWMLLMESLCLRSLGRFHACCCRCLCRRRSFCCKKTDMAFRFISGCSRGVESGEEGLAVGNMSGCGRHGGNSTPGTSAGEHSVEAAGEGIGSACRNERGTAGCIVELGAARSCGELVGDATGVLVTDPNTDRLNRSRTLS